MTQRAQTERASSTRREDVCTGGLMYPYPSDKQKCKLRNFSVYAALCLFVVIEAIR